MRTEGLRVRLCSTVVMILQRFKQGNLQVLIIRVLSPYLRVLWPTTFVLTSPGYLLECFFHKPNQNQHQSFFWLPGCVLHTAGRT